MSDPSTHSADAVRLAKRIAELASCSRSEAEQYIAGGWVTVDGEVAEEPAMRVTTAQQVVLSDDAKLGSLEPVTILLHKPAGMATDEAAALITAESLSPDHRSGLHFLKQHLRGLNLTDRLEDSASGLLVYTQDWRVARKLVDDAPKTEYEYIVEVAGDIVPNGLQLLNHGLKFNKRDLPPIKVSWQNETRLRFALKTPPRGLLEHMCGQVGLTVVSMKRIRIGRMPLAGIAVGQWRYLLGYERF
jgi:23S rRNA pseudouridine2604 synthase